MVIEITSHIFFNINRLFLNFMVKENGLSRMRWWKTHINKQKAYDEICRRITNNDKRTVIAFGNGGFSSTSRGHASGPVKQFLWELRKRCRVRIVDEYRTSKICSLRNERFHAHQKFWSVRLCKNIGCLVNIIFFFLFEIRYIYISQYLYYFYFYRLIGIAMLMQPVI